MKEKRVSFGQGNISLEALYAPAGGTVGAVISHPHPLRGGDMNNYVVEILAETLFAAGISTLRFNFRGVGESTGTFDDGEGEQDDVLAAISFIEEQGIQEILPAGYSFGAWVTAKILGRKELLPALFVAPPLGIFAFDWQPLRGKVGLIACGDQDPYCPVEKITSLAAELASRLEIVPRADHFFQFREQDLALVISNFVSQLKP